MMMEVAIARKVQARKKRATKRSALHQERADAYSKLAGDSKRARRMDQVEEFQVVPTIFTGFNRASVVGGAPLSCLYLIHGPSGGGKTAWALGLIVSFQRAGALCAFVDAEMSGDVHKWFKQLGVDAKRCIYIGRTGEEEDQSPLTYEEVVGEVDGLIDRYKQMKREGSIPWGTPLIIVVDSISRMVPADLMKRLKKDGPKALKSGYGREQANMNKAWLAELGTKVGDDLILFAVIAHENESESSSSWGPEYKVRGGNAVIYDAMMQVRVTYAGQVKDLAVDTAPAVGKRHSAILLKSKHGPPFEKFTFYTSNGKGVCPIGFDRTREVIHEGLVRGVVAGPKEVKKVTLGSKVKWKGKEVTLKQLFTKPEYAEVVESIARELDAGLVEDE